MKLYCIRIPKKLPATTQDPPIPIPFFRMAAESGWEAAFQRMNAKQVSAFNTFTKSILNPEAHKLYILHGNGGTGMV